MEKIKTFAGLKDAIAELEIRQKEQGMQLRYQANFAYESLKPVNLIKSVFSDSSGIDNKKGNLISNSLGLSAGYIIKIMIEGAMRRPLNRLAGTAVMFGIQSLIAKNPNTLRAIGAGLFSLIRHRKQRRPTEPETVNEFKHEAT